MTEKDNSGLVKIRRALISVSDKTGIVEFASGLKRFGVEIISTGGTAKALREAGIDVRDVSDVTGFPEMMDGRVKTLHPKIHGALLAQRDNPEHEAAMREHGVESIDMVVINLYPFERTIAREGVTLGEAIEQIDIGGPAMMRSAAKNFRDIAVVADPDRYEPILREMNNHDGALAMSTRQRLALAAFIRTAQYDQAIAHYLFRRALPDLLKETGLDDAETENLELPAQIDLFGVKASNLRYGENPHQLAAIYTVQDGPLGLVQAQILSGKEMSFNNYVDADAACQLVYDFDEIACAIIKHTNPCGVALGGSPEEAYRAALACDPVSAFGGIVSFNRKVDEAAARAVTEIFTEVIIAPGYDDAALEVLRSKKNLRVLFPEFPFASGLVEYKQISGGMLVQTRDTHRMKREGLNVVTKRAPAEKEIDDLLFAWTVCKHTKSNAIVYARDNQTIGVGAGQMSRVDSVKIGAMRAQLPLEGSVLASDAFFPFRDGIDEAAKHGITAIIQPGGSVRDEEAIAAANENNLAMVFTGVRHFKH
jgi:phosphoribosylaminoimidazolecarboxamide formyltransferase/IMP cyclohydrolase